MLNCPRLRAAPSSGALITGLILIGFLVPGAFASSSGDEDVQRFFDPLPPEVLAKFAPDQIGGKYTQGTQQSGEGTQQQFEDLPIERVIPIITGVSDLGGLPVIEFQVLDQFGFGVEGFVQEENVEFEFTVSKLAPARNGKPAFWRTYITADDEGDEGISAGAYLDGTLEDLGDGNYRFTFAEGLEEIGGETYRPNATHRVGMEVRDPAPFGEEVEGSDTAFDILPATGETEDDGIASRNLVAQENCTVCHGDETFAFHGGPRQSVKQCVSCHQRFKRDGGGNETSIDFGFMIHGIHNAQNLTQGGLVYCGFGCENFGRPPDDFSHVVYPQSVRNCTVCHNPDNPETPQASNIDDMAYAESCASCHDDLAYDNNGLTNANGNHIGLAQPNDTCEACHSPNGLLQGNLAYHAIPSQEAAKRFSYNILDITNTAEGQSPMVTFSVTDPTNDDAPYDLATDPVFTGSGARFVMVFAWPNADFNNVANSAGNTTTGRPAGQPAGVNLLPSGGALPSYITDNGDGTYTVDTMALSTPLVVPSTMPALGSGTVLLEGHLAGDFDRDGDFDEEVPVTNATMAFAINDDSAQGRRVVVSLSKCQDCHNMNDGLSIHGGNRTDNVEGCATCHTANATDLFRRPVDPDGMVNGVNSAAADMLEDRTVSLGYMIHSIHAASVREEGYVAYGFGGSVHDYSDASYPRSPAECGACHEGDSYTLPVAEGVLAVTTEANATVTGNSFFGANAFAPGDGSANDPTDDNNVSAETAACLSCHNSDIAIDHMSVRSDSGFAFGNGWLQNPNPFTDPDTQAFIDSAAPENCAFCHSEGSFVPVSEVHGID